MAYLRVIRTFIGSSSSYEPTLLTKESDTEGNWLLVNTGQDIFIDWQGNKDAKWCQPHIKAEEAKHFQVGKLPQSHQIEIPLHVSNDEEDHKSDWFPILPLNIWEGHNNE